MPAKPQWFHRVAEIRIALAAAGVAELDRAGVERLFGVSRRQAIRLLSRFGRPRRGKDLRVPAARVAAWLTTLEAGEAFAGERDRRRRLRDAVLEARSMVEARKVSFRTVSPTAERPTIKNLPAGVEIAPGELRIVFDEPTQLLEKLFALSKAIAGDFPTFETISRTGERADAERLRSGHAR